MYSSEYSRISATECYVVVRHACEMWDFDVTKVRNVTLFELKREINRTTGTAYYTNDIDLHLSQFVFGWRPGHTEGGYLSDPQDIWEAVFKLAAHEVWHLVQFERDSRLPTDERMTREEREREADYKEMMAILEFRENRPSWADDKRRTWLEWFGRMALKVYWVFRKPKEGTKGCELSH